MSDGTVHIPLTKLEIAASRGAVRAVMDSMSSATGGTSLPLTTAAEKFDRALSRLNEAAGDSEPAPHIHEGAREGL